MTIRGQWSGLTRVGCSVIWGQLLNLCTPVDLRKSYPVLANQLGSLSTSLETAGTQSNAVAHGVKPPSLEVIANQSHSLALERDAVLQQIRALPGFERFLSSKPISELLLAAQKGPVAIRKSFMFHFGSSHCFKHSSWRIWWCPTGPLAFLPIHAAGLYGKDQAFGSTLSDFLISSYTPSLTALIQGYRPQSGSKEDRQLLAVTRPSAKGQSYIPGTQDEIKFIK
ncbi:hypothetical protein DFH07DRAFT_775743 [Mycena maculata]|uniref:Uncharacterized protein n=1 Tax=Mycena maculata TaxID=230809 RepID=A0AAD7N645_9AGAR|nr:hypothetical protein DFH07DRAFT_775743 [Mycena maculata]